MAAKYDVGARIGLEGEKEFKQSLKDIDAGLRVLDSEMKLVSAQYAGQEKSTESLTAAQDVLQRTMYSQREKVQALDQQLKSAAQTFGEAHSRTMTLQTSLNKANTALLKTDQELRNTTKALSDLNQKEDGAQKNTGILQKALAKLTGSMKDTKKSTDEASKEIGNLDNNSKGLGDTVNDLGGKFGIKLPEGLSKTLNGFGKVNPASLAAAAGFAAVAAAIIKVEKALIDLTKEQAAAADELLTTATITGISTQALQEYAYAAELIDVSVDTLVDSQEKLIRNMGNAQRGTQQQVEAFEKLGVSYKNADGSLRDGQTVFWETIDALGQMKNETERDAIAMQLLGRSARDLNPLIKAGSDTLKEFGKEAHEMGYVLDKEALDALGEVDDAMQRFKNTTDATKKLVAAEFAPQMEIAMTKASKLVSDLGKAFKDSGIATAFGMLLNSAIDLISPVDELGEETIPKLTESLRPLAILAASIANVFDYVKALVSLDAKGVWKTFGFGYTYGNGNKVQTLYEQFEQSDINAATKSSGYGQYYADGKWYSSYDEYLRSKFDPSSFNGTFEAWKQLNNYNASGNDNWRGGWSWVGENGPERVYLPQGTQIQNAQESREAGGDTTVYVTIDAKNVKEFNDIIEIVKTERMRTRKVMA